MPSSLESLSLRNLEFWCVRFILKQIVSASYFSRFFTISYIVAMIYLLESALKVIENLRSFLRRSVSIWASCLEDILITHVLLSVMLVARCVTSFLPISSSNFRICLFFVKSKDYLYEFWPIFSARWSSSGVIDSKVLPFNGSMLFLSLPRITWLICIHSYNNIFLIISTNWWRCNKRTSILNHSRNSYAGSWRYCNIYESSKSFEKICWWHLFYSQTCALQKLFPSNQQTSSKY